MARASPNTEPAGGRRKQVRETYCARECAARSTKLATGFYPFPPVERF